MKFLISFLTSTFLSIVAIQAQPLIQNPTAHEIVSLDGTWSYLIDPYESGYYNYHRIPYEEANTPEWAFYYNAKQTDKKQRIEYEFNPAQTLYVPSDWNSQKKELLYYEGTVWYQKDFNLEKKADKRYFIYFGAVNYESRVYINGAPAGTHVGGFTQFNLDITEYVKSGVNSVVVKADNRRKVEGVPTDNTDWWNYGGITRHVGILETENKFVQSYSVQLTDLKTKSITCKVKVDNATKGNVTLSIPELDESVRIKLNEKGEGEETFKASKCELWSPDTPKLYEVSLQYGDKKIADKIGFRTIETKGTDILLNGESIYLKGISIHEENPLSMSRATGLSDSRVLLGWAKDLGCNYVRLAHYPHNSTMTKLADEMGIIVWSEIPVYWTITWTQEATLNNAKNQLSEMISRDINRASIGIWSIGNETPISDERMKFMSTLAKEAKALDGSRLISAALELHYVPNTKTAVLEDPLAEHLDIMSFNQYIGWYGNTLEEITEFEFKFKQEKPVIVSETGAGALGGYLADTETVWSEEFQEEFYKQQIKLISKHDQIKGMTPWVLADFRSPKRLNPRFQQGWNRKGLVSNTGKKKKAFYVLKEYYEQK